VSLERGAHSWLTQVSEAGSITLLSVSFLLAFLSLLSSKEEEWSITGLGKGQQKTFMEGFASQFPLWDCVLETMDHLQFILSISLFRAT